MEPIIALKPLTIEQELLIEAIKTKSIDEIEFLLEHPDVDPMENDVIKHVLDTDNVDVFKIFEKDPRVISGYKDDVQSLYDYVSSTKRDNLMVYIKSRMPEVVVSEHHFIIYANESNLISIEDVMKRNIINPACGKAAAFRYAFKNSDTDMMCLLMEDVRVKTCIEEEFPEMYDKYIRMLVAPSIPITASPVTEVIPPAPIEAKEIDDEDEDGYSPGEDDDEGREEENDEDEFKSTILSELASV